MRLIELEILLALAAGPRHGWAIIREIEQRGDGARTIETGTLYRALQRLVEQKLAAPAETPGDAAHDDGRRRYYAITAAGRRAAADEARRLAALVESARAARLIPTAS